MTILPADEFSCAYVCQNLRELDAKEVFAIRDHADPMLLAREWELVEMKWVISHETRPAALVGVQRMWNGVYTVMLLTTPDFPKVVLAFTKFVTKVIIPALFDDGAHRAQVCVLAEYEQACRLLILLGAKQTAILRHYGRNGEDFFIFSWLREDIADGNVRPKRQFSRTRAAGRGTAQS